MADKQPKKPVVLDAETLAAIDEGIRSADADPRRWTLEEALQFARSEMDRWDELRHSQP